MNLGVWAFLALIALSNADSSYISPGSDIIFVVDASARVGQKNFQNNVIPFLQSLIEYWKIDPSANQVGFITYGNGAHMGPTLKASGGTMSAMNNIAKLKYSGGKATASAAMQMAYSQGFKASNGGRAGRPQIIVHIGAGADGQNPQAYIQQVKNAVSGGKKVYNVAVGQGWTQTIIKQSSSGPSSSYTLKAKNWKTDTLESLIPVLVDKINHQLPLTNSGLPPVTGCLTATDIAIIIDGSYSVQLSNFLKIQNSLQTFASKIPISKNGVHLGVVQFSGKPTLEFPLNKYLDRISAMKAIQKIQYMGGGTRTDVALKFARTNIFSPNFGARPNVPRVAVVVTDGHSPSIQKTINEADKARQEGIDVLAVGIGPLVNQKELKGIAGNDDQKVWTGSDFDDLSGIISKVLKETCKATVTVGPEVPTTPMDPSLETCKDLIPNCANYEKGFCAKYGGWSKKQCPRFCGFCTTVIPPVIKPCEDLFTNCTVYNINSNCLDPKYAGFFTERCAKTCGYCDLKKNSLTGFKNKQCMYNGKAYNPGETFSVGCDYDCTCMDDTGKMECTNKCDLYYNLPAGCTLVKKEGECCLKPVCNFKTTGKINSFTTTGQGKDPSGNPVCVYKGQNYKQNQYFEDSCDYKCTCVDAVAGTTQCRDYCPHYDESSLPKGCFMYREPGSCCDKPKCEFTTTIGKFTSTGSVSGYGTSKPIFHPERCRDLTPNCKIFDGSPQSCHSGKFKPYMTANCAKFCGLCDVTFPQKMKPRSEDVCFFEGKNYTQGQVWEPDCATTCTCDSQYYGYYRCTSKCVQYQDIPDGCSLVNNGSTCCPQIVCQNGKVIIPSTTNILSKGSGDNIYTVTPSGQKVPILPKVLTNGKIDPNNQGQKIPPIPGCLINGKFLMQGEFATSESCGPTCQCLDAVTGRMSCTDRCPTYTPDNDQCTMVADPSDPCCKVVDCPASVTNPPRARYNKPKVVFGVVKMPDPIKLVPTKLPQTVKPATTTEAPDNTGTTVEFTGTTHHGTKPALNTPASYVPLPTSPPGYIPSTGTGKCVMPLNGVNKTYEQNESWRQGCDFNCLCYDAPKNLYSCNPICKRFQEPPGMVCTHKIDPAESCCSLLDCRLPTLPPDTTPGSVGPDDKSTPMLPTMEYCVYKGTKHLQGSVWLPDCDNKCKCIDAKANLYACGDRCPKYFNRPSGPGCTEIADPNDPCCKIPVCTPPLQSSQNPLIPPTLPGPGFEVTVKPGISFCQYNNKNYKQDDTWFKGCDYKCTCIDQLQGRASCEPRCPRYDTSKLPPFCKMVVDPTDTCCKKAECDYKYTIDKIGGKRGGTKVPPIYQTLSPSTNPEDIPRCIVGADKYFQGNEWFDGCSKKCRCEDAVKNLISCEDRCPTITPQPGCAIVTDPNNVCCKKKLCPLPDDMITPKVPINPNRIPTLKPDIITGGPQRPTPTPGIDGKVPTLPPLNGCLYKSKTYDQDDTWFDGCDLKCECVDAVNGKYQCTDRCTKFPSKLPPQCQLVPIPGDMCCKEIDCDANPLLVTAAPNIDGLTVTPSPAYHIPTLPDGRDIIPKTPAPEVCVDGNLQYTVGQMWYKDCDLKCFCDEGGKKRCQARCRDYPQMGAEYACTAIPDPDDPGCCQKPKCTLKVPPTPMRGPHTLQTLAPKGKLTGVGPTKVPQILDPNNPKPTLAPKCNYKGTEYGAHEEWSDGCKYRCKCIDAVADKYECTDMCGSYPPPPNGCYLIRDVNNPCCQVPFCPDDPSLLTPTPAPTGINGETLRPPVTKPPPSKCIYKGVAYNQGVTWNDGCSSTCTCDNAEKGEMRCNKRCQSFENVDPSCTWVTDSNDACCRRPVCAPIMPPTIVPPTGPDGKTLEPSFRVPIPTAKPAIKTGQRVDGPNTDPSKPKKCEYKGNTYSDGETWEDGPCGQNCTCIDEIKGKYKCVDRCPVYKPEDMPFYCQLVSDPKDSCCQIPKCVDPNKVPQLDTATPAPLRVSGKTVSPSILVPTYKTNTVCDYKSKLYLKGQTWDDGCLKTCTCVDTGISGLHAVCKDRCPQYGPLPSGCTLVTDPNDADCCQVVSCAPKLGPDGKLATLAPSPLPFTVTGVPGIIYGKAATPKPGDPKNPSKRCIYNDQEYVTGQSWRDGCSKTCVCLDQNEGTYKCTEMCSKFPNVPAQCSLIRDPKNICCSVMYCDPNQKIPDPYATPPTQAPRTPKITFTPDPHAPKTPRPIPTDPPSLAPGQTTGKTPIPPLSRQFCVYKGAQYRQGATFNRNCQTTCRCDDADNNVVNCFNRCPVYSDIGDDCTLEVDPNDSCCKIKTCFKVPNIINVVTQAPKPGDPSKIPVPQPTIIPGKDVIGENKNPKPQDDGLCVYKDQSYKVGATWKDGCGVTCKCLESLHNKYKCTDKCNKFVNVPTNCEVKKDADNCCDKVTCYDPALLKTVAPPTLPNGKTLKPDQIPTLPSAPKCVFDGKTFTQGQVYYDNNCNQRCVCEDAAANYMSCAPRCKTYQASSSCELVQDPKDPQCCKIPKCTPQDPNNPNGVTGGYTAYQTPPLNTPSLAPGFTPESTLTPPTRPVGCYSKKNLYKQGDKWQDNCQTCECEDEIAGKIKCVAMCPDYPDLPAYCTYEYDPMNPCCRKPVCNKPTLSPSADPGDSTLIPVLNYCVFNGVPHNQGDTWQTGCSDTYTCEDALSNTISKQDRCAKPDVIPQNCQLVTDPKDSCCQILSCTQPNTKDPQKVHFGVPGKITGHSKSPQPSNPLQPRKVGCFINQQLYRQGDTWNEGCTLVCECKDETTGFYSCDERCAPTPPAAPSCTKIADPNDKCCFKLSCTPPSLLIPKVTDVPNPLDPSASPVPVLRPNVKGVCLSDGQYYRLHQIWYKGTCDQVCRCDDTDLNIVNCREVCPKIQPSSGCTLINDPQNPCCKIEDCPQPPTVTPPKPGYYRPHTKPVIVYGKPQPSLTLQPGQKPQKYDGCIFNGQKYQDGEKFQDGCKFNCECEDPKSGLFKCVQRCPSIIPRPECVIAKDPNDPCCEVLYCDFKNPKPFPTGIPTDVNVVGPNLKPTKQPYVQPGYKTPSPKPQGPVKPVLGFCLSDGTQYLQGQSWNVNCDKTCTCVNASSGAISCVNRCPSFGAPRPNCQMRTSPVDQCCLIEDCAPSFTDPIFRVTADPSATAPPTYGPGIVGPNQVVIRPGNPAQYTRTYSKPTPGYGMDPKKYKTVCVIDTGKTYKQGQRWSTNNEDCVCIDVTQNKAQCTQKCAPFYYLPDGCVTKQDPYNPPCLIAVCPQDKVKTPVPMTKGPEVTTRSTQPTQSPKIPAAPVCIYTDGKIYNQDDTWTDGCQECKCIDARGNNYQCTRKCPLYTGLPKYCKLEKDSSNPCCDKPVCKKPDGTVLIPLIPDVITKKFPQIDPTKTNILPITVHKVVTGRGKPVGISQSVLRQYGGKDACVYKSILYRPGESWDDGCEYTCTCEKNAGGLYSCVDKCGITPPSPSYCHKVTVPGQCCETMTCNIPTLGQYVPGKTISHITPGKIPQMIPGKTSSVVIPLTKDPSTITVPGNGYYVSNGDIRKVNDRCIVNNKAYKLGEKWSEGCGTECECLDASSGFYSCKQICPSYPNMLPGCVMTTVAGHCCKRLICNNPDTGLTFDPLLNPRKDMPIYATYKPGRSGFRPYYIPYGVSSSFVGCYFKGNVYTEGQKWQDGCDGVCSCLNGQTHEFQCSAKCWSYSTIPSACSVQQDPNDHCCTQVKCPQTSMLTPTPIIHPGVNISTGQCIDTLDNCQDYSVAACGPKTIQWARKYCPRFCGLCGAGLQVPTCADKESNCKLYRKSDCFSKDYKWWMYSNCYKTCGYCANCQDLDSYCTQMDKHYCTGAWKNWAQIVCAKSCNYCNQPTISTPTGAGKVATGYYLLFKGTSGARGNMYTVWNTKGGINVNNNQAKVLTSTYGGYYRSPLLDSFGRCNFDKIRVSVYNNGYEKAYIVFNTRGKTKDNWYDPQNIIESSYNDIRGPNSKFRLSMTPMIDRTFTFGKGASSCNGTGWFFVSNKQNGCGFEKGNNAIYFSNGKTAAGYGNMQKGDVFAVAASGGNCDPNKPIEQQCQYRGKTYNIGDVWQEGCSENCTCKKVNSTALSIECMQTGCPRYTYLPPGCHEVPPKAGECCGSLEGTCNGGCQDKAGNIKQPGEKWDEGCDSMCQCMKTGNTFTVSCETICLEYNLDTIPPDTRKKCVFPKPPPGKCCALPQCPGVSFPPIRADRKKYY